MGHGHHSALVLPATESARMGVALARANMQDLEHKVIVLCLHFSLPISILFPCFGPQVGELIRLRLRLINSAFHVEQSIQMVLVLIVIAEYLCVVLRVAINSLHV